MDNLLNIEKLVTISPKQPFKVKWTLKLLELYLLFLLKEKKNLETPFSPSHSTTNSYEIHVSLQSLFHKNENDNFYEKFIHAWRKNVFPVCQLLAHLRVCLERLIKREEKPSRHDENVRNINCLCTAHDHDEARCCLLGFESPCNMNHESTKRALEKCFPPSPTHPPLLHREKQDFLSFELCICKTKTPLIQEECWKMFSLSRFYH